MPIEKTCQNCNKLFFVKPSWVNKTKFCSLACYKVLRKNRCGRNCVQCGKIFYVISFKVEGKYCSRKCYHFKPEISEKQCSICNDILPLKCFRKNHTFCKFCNSTKNIVRNSPGQNSRWTSKEELQKKLADWEIESKIKKHLAKNSDLKWCYFGKHFINADKINGNRPCFDCRKVDYKNNKTEIMKKGFEYRKRNKVILAQRKKVDYQNNKEYYKFLAKKRKSKLRAAKGDFTLNQWKAKIEYFGNRCYLCGTSLEGKTVHLEHRIPVSKGGTNWISNLAPACQNCNLSKRDKTEKEFYEYRNIVGYQNNRVIKNSPYRSSVSHCKLSSFN